MADPTPLLLPPTSTDPEEPPPLVPPKKSFEDIIDECSHGCSIFFLRSPAFACFAWAFDAQQTFITVFSDAKPSWHCTDHLDATCRAAASNCILPAGSWAWDRPARGLIWSEWDVECAYGSSIVAGVPMLSFFVGCLIGGIILPCLADSCLGRKKMLFISCFMMCLASTLTPLSGNIWVYSVFRFFSGVGRSSVVTSSLVLSTETVGRSLRSWASFLGYIFFTAGFLSLPFIARHNSDSWRALYLWTSVPGLAYSLAVCILVRESPRWLAVRGRREEALQILEDMAGREIADDLDCDEMAGEQESKGGFLSAMRKLYKEDWSRKRAIAVIAAGLGIGMIYYGMPVAIGSTGDAYDSISLTAFFEIPSAILSWWLNRNGKRRTTMLALTMASAGASLASFMLEGGGHPTMTTTAKMTAFFCGCTALNVLLFYVLELFPTCVRNSAMSLIREALVLPAALVPILVTFGNGNLKPTFLIMSIVMGIGALFAWLLPETRGEKMCDTMEEQGLREKRRASAGS